MISVNSISGGRTSAYLAVHYPADFNVFSVVCLDDHACAPKDPALVEYAQAKLSSFVPQFGEFIATAEDDETLRAVMDLEQLLGREIAWVRGISFDQLIDVGDWKGLKTRLPSWSRRYCTHSMKLLPIFLWWWQNINARCDMRIGFRADEFVRMERFFNNSDPTNFSMPISCSLRGERRQTHQTFHWRYCSFPMIRDGVTSAHVHDYWARNGWLGGNLWEEARQIRFPTVSNCIGCFHKKPEVLAAMADMHPTKFQWFADQETKGKGRWLDQQLTYQHIADNRQDIGREVIFETREMHAACHSGGCTE